MKLVPEQVKYLRERKEQLLQARETYIKYCQNRERTQMDGVSSGYVVDYQHEYDFIHNLRELEEIEKILSLGEFVSDRNLDTIDIGTSFSVRFDEDDENNHMMLVDAKGAIGTLYFIAIDTDFGNAVLGKKEGDAVTYKVQATGRQISLTIDEIEKVKDNYEHFIREKTHASRISGSEKEELRRLKKEDIEEYNKRHEITESQKSLLEEELGKISINTKNLSEIRRRSVIKKTLESPVAIPPEDDSIGIGSHVIISLMDENGDLIEKSIEVINQAVSTELESHYVERISPLGHAIYGLHINDAFTIRRNHKPALKGLVDAVDNNYYMKNERVK